MEGLPDFIYFSLTLWVDESKITDQEKIDNVEFATTGGYLKVLTYKEAWLNAWNNATEEDKELLYALPNFNAEVFKEISGIDVNESSNEMTIEELEKLAHEVERRHGYKQVRTPISPRKTSLSAVVTCPAVSVTSGLR